MQEVVVVIPIYKPVPDKLEKLSFEQCINVLPYPISIVAPTSLDVSYYKQKSKQIFIQRFDDDFFTSINSYNKLLLSKIFYKRFENFNYMLIHQLDAYVFKDELAFWCSNGYDYIGAPWFEDFKDKGEELWKVGNGGFSLRNIKSATKVLKKKGRNRRACFF